MEVILPLIVVYLTKLRSLFQALSGCLLVHGVLFCEQSGPNRLWTLSGCSESGEVQESEQKVALDKPVRRVWIHAPLEMAKFFLCVVSVSSFQLLFINYFSFQTKTFSCYNNLISLMQPGTNASFLPASFPYQISNFASSMSQDLPLFFVEAQANSLWCKAVTENTQKTLSFSVAEYYKRWRVKKVVQFFQFLHWNQLTLCACFIRMKEDGCSAEPLFRRGLTRQLMMKGSAVAELIAHFVVPVAAFVHLYGQLMHKLRKRVDTSEGTTSVTNKVKVLVSESPKFFTLLYQKTKYPTYAASPRE